MSTTLEIDDALDLAEQIDREHELCREATVSVVEHAVRAGELLVQAKDRRGHGAWTSWLEQHCSVTPRQARRYMSLAKNQDRLDEAKRTWKSDFTLAEAMELLSELQESPQAECATEETASERRRRKGRPSNKARNAARQEKAYQRQIKMHRAHCSRLRRFMDEDQPPNGDGAVQEAIDADMNYFTKDVARAARKHGRKLCRSLRKAPRSEGVFFAMLLALRLKDTLDPETLFEPVSSRLVGQQK